MRVFDPPVLEESGSDEKEDCGEEEEEEEVGEDAFCPVSGERALHWPIDPESVCFEDDDVDHEVGECVERGEEGAEPS